MLAPDGHCYAFDRRASGIVPGEAVVAVVVKRLTDAMEDGDPVRAVVVGHGINYDGRTNGITAPSGQAQRTLIEGVHERFGLDARSIGHVVAHGTGTRLGDPVEVQALNAAFRKQTDACGWCALTSVKPNLGHTFAASGLVSVVALVQGLANEAIPPSLNCEEPSDYLDWATSPFFVNRTLRPWPRNLGARRFGAVSAFGMSGTNTHVVLSEPPIPRLEPT
jgi:acyl transferase domain-containing protein